MKTLSLSATHNTPEIYFSTDENRFMISGKSAPEDVRGLYYPVVEWISSFVEEIKADNPFSRNNPLIFRLDLDYFNSSSAKFLFDIFTTLKGLKLNGTPVIIEWHHDSEDTDLREAGEDMAMLSGLEFMFFPEERSDL